MDAIARTRAAANDRSADKKILEHCLAGKLTLQMTRHILYCIRLHPQAFKEAIARLQGYEWRNHIGGLKAVGRLRSTATTAVILTHWTSIDLLCPYGYLMDPSGGNITILRSWIYY
jgi:hypothetical protein